MKALYIILGFALMLGVLSGHPALQFTCVACAFGWLAFEENKKKRRRYGSDDC